MFLVSSWVLTVECKNVVQAVIKENSGRLLSSSSTRVKLGLQNHGKREILSRADFE